MLIPDMWAEETHQGHRWVEAKSFSDGSMEIMHFVQVLISEAFRELNDSVAKTRRTEIGDVLRLAARSFFFQNIFQLRDYVFHHLGILTELAEEPGESEGSSVSARDDEVDENVP